MTSQGAVSYATVDDLSDWLPSDVTVPEDATSLLRSATIAVAWACVRDIYTDVPAAAEVAPLRDATCAQATSWITLGVTPDNRGVASAPVKSTKVLTGSVDYDTTAQSATLISAADELAPEARTILLSAGLLYVPAPLGDETGWLPSWGLDVPRLGYPGLAESPYGTSWPFQ